METTSTPKGVTLGLDTFGDVTDGDDGRPLTHAQTIRNLVDQGILADQVGVDYFGIGEHHTDYSPPSAGDVVLGAIAARTSRIHLGSAVTVISSDDPVRLPALRDARRTLARSGRSDPRSRVQHRIVPAVRLRPARLRGALRGEGQPLRRAAQGATGDVEWNHSPRHRRSLGVSPYTASGSIPTWIGVGGRPESVVRAARYGFSLMLAIIGGSIERFAPFVSLFRKALGKLGFSERPVGVHSPGHIAATDEQAREEFWPFYADLVSSSTARRSYPSFVTCSREHFLQGVA